MKRLYKIGDVLRRNPTHDYWNKIQIKPDNRVLVLDAGDRAKIDIGSLFIIDNVTFIYDKSPQWVLDEVFEMDEILKKYEVPER